MESVTASVPWKTPSLNHSALYLSNTSPIRSSINLVISICLTISATISSTFSPQALAASSPSKNASMKASPSSFAISSAVPPIIVSTTSFITSAASSPSSCIWRSHSFIFDLSVFFLSFSALICFWSNNCCSARLLSLSRVSLNLFSPRRLLSVYLRFE